MLERVDRMQLAVRDGAEAARSFGAILGAEKVREDALSLYSAKRTVVQAGDSEFELLEPNGPGPVADHIEQWREGIFAAGFSTNDLGDVSSSMSAAGVTYRDEGGQLFVEADQTRGMRMVISEHREKPKVGLISYVYEATNIVGDWEEAADFYANAFGLDQSRFSPITSEQYGYTGTLTLFDPPAKLDRIELTQITHPSGAMGRFFERRGPSIYMCYVETEDVRAIQDRLEAREARYTGRTDDPNPEGIFIHPTALHGMLMGVSRTNLAWRWSGRPELAKV
jgi:catechol 2,3-dioxygenase-like lactoylglutathione lyase family enzyme